MDATRKLVEAGRRHPEPLPPYRILDPVEVQRITREAERLRAAILADGARRLFGPLVRHLAEHGVAPVRRWYRRRRDLRLLRRLDDRTLADIGLERADLEAVRLGRVQFRPASRPRTGSGRIVPLKREPRPASGAGDLDRAA